MNFFFINKIMIKAKNLEQSALREYQHNLALRALQSLKSMGRYIILFGLLYLLINPNQTFSAEWTIGQGPYGGDRARVLFDPNNSDILYTDSFDYAGVSISRDGGQTWSQTSIDDGLSSIAVIDNNGITRVFAALHGIGSAGFYMSEDNGETWLELFSDSCINIKADPNRSNRLLLVTQPENGYFSTLHLSEDYGDTWRELVLPYSFIFSPMLTPPHDIAFDPTDPDVIYLGSNIYATCTTSPSCLKRETAIFKYNIKNNTLTYIYESDKDEKLSMVDVVAVNGNPVIYASFMRRPVNGFIRSLNAGETWQDIPLRTYSLSGNFVKIVKNPVITGFLVHPIDYSFIVGVINSQNSSIDRGLYKSIDGIHWLQVTQTSFTTLQYLRDMISVHPDNPDILMAGMAEEAVQISRDRGLTWTITNKGLSGYNIFDTEVDPTNDDIIYSLGENVVYKNTDGLSTDTWTSHFLNLSAPTANLEGGIAIHPVNSDILLVGAGWDLSAGSHSGGIYRSTDGADTWSAVLTTGNPQIMKIFFSKYNPNLAVAVAMHDTTSSNTAKGVYISNNAGNTWQSMYSLSDMYAVAEHPSKACIQVAAGAAVSMDTQGMLLFTTNCWKNIISMPLSVGYLTGVAIIDNPANPKGYYVIVSTHDGIILRIDTLTGLSEKVFTINNVTGTSIHVNPQYPNEVYVSVACGYEGDCTGGIFQSTDYGSIGSWYEFNQGMQGSQLDDFNLSFSSDGKTIFASTLGGVVKRNIN